MVDADPAAASDAEAPAAAAVGAVRAGLDGPAVGPRPITAPAVLGAGRLAGCAAGIARVVPAPDVCGGAGRDGEADGPAGGGAVGRPVGLLVGLGVGAAIGQIVVNGMLRGCRDAPFW